MVRSLKYKKAEGHDKIISKRVKYGEVDLVKNQLGDIFNEILSMQQGRKFCIQGGRGLGGRRDINTIRQNLY